MGFVDLGYLGFVLLGLVGGYSGYVLVGFDFRDLLFGLMFLVFWCFCIFLSLGRWVLGFLILSWV